MHITYDYQIFGFQKYGGVSRYFHEIATLIPCIAGDTVDVFSPLYVNEYIRSEARTRVWGLKIPQTRPNLIAARITNVALTTLRSTVSRSSDIFHETYYSKRDHGPRSAKRIITVYDMIHEKFFESFPHADKVRRAKKSAIRRADHVICISENTRRDLIEITGIPEEVTSVVHLGYALTNIPQSALPDWQKSPYILYVGLRDGYKNFHRLLAAYSNSGLQRDFLLVCFGGGPLKDREISLIRSLGLQPQNIIVLSGDDSVLSALYVSASAFVYPSLYEGFGIPPLEAMSLGCPVACSNTSSLPEVVGAAAELFDPRDVDDMGAALSRVLLSTDHSKDLIRLGHERIKHFSWAKCANETLNVYRQLVGG
ncbi:glycosyltransferase family 4 protein [Rhodanobacter sp. FDAARGOS 1247]|uniref:glycosyltransferase family 4 protein n=1 Tax=Rhodanobacter sp. FDAARGOS 1247 TaxID=2778082 RepID=UPI00194DBAD5|nr:glycosyltransferase family 1 protein [Rhodanobacter sp. FDAARGOS 1247]QRP64724.1 glycosyltransferase family 4 protein [Rhodanobacter sp. FDAARGOS 1247]